MKTAIMLIGSFLCMTTAVHAGQGPQKDAFWDKLQSKLEKLTPTKKAPATTAVGGVRGAKNDDASDIYWKGKEKPVEISEEELQKLNLAFESRLKGDNKLALKQFEEFLNQYPQSHFRIEGLQAVEQIKMELAATKTSAKVEATPQPAATAPQGEGSEAKSNLAR